MAVTSLDTTISGTLPAITATASATAAPGSTTDGFGTVRYPRVRALLAYVGTVSTCVLTAWVRDRQTGVWYRLRDTGIGDTPALAPGAGPTNEARDFEVGRQQEVFFQVSAITGGGTAAVRIQPVEPGGY